MAYEFIKTETDGRLFIVTINRPDQLNCLHPMGNAEMGQAFDEFAANPDLWVAIVTGAGEKAFSAGNDLKFAASGQKSPVPMPVPSAVIKTRISSDEIILSKRAFSTFRILPLSGKMA